jgi:formylglycine-generating enzyme required for sulfatase activity
MMKEDKGFRRELVPQEASKPVAGKRLPLSAWLVGGGALVLLVMVASCGGESEQGMVEQHVRETVAALALQQTQSAAKTEAARPTATLTPVPTPTTTPTATPIPTPGIGSTMLSPVDEMEQVYVPEGTFLMGSTRQEIDAVMADCPDCERSWFGGELPQLEVYLDAFWIDRTEVTNAMYAAFLNDRGNQEEGGARWLEPSSEHSHLHKRGGEWKADAGYEDHPVIEVSWYGARAYCEWAGRRLPTEAEWEKAARGTQGQLYPWGDEPPTCSLTQYRGCSGRTVAVGSKPEGESPYGAWDMAGNVYEWVADWLDYDYYETSPAENPPGPETGTDRGLRGGSCGNNPWDLRTACRSWLSPEYTLTSVGFRCARSP